MVVYGTRELSCRAHAYLLLEQAALAHWGMDGLPPIGRAPEGKPFFPGLSRREFNLSHSGALALCALDADPVGVDIQTVRSWRAGLPRRVCSAAELAWLEKEAELWSGFALLWALKESRVKCTGRGLREKLSGIRVPLPEGGKTLYRLDGMWFRIYGGEGWRGAACGFSPPPEEISWLSLPQERETPPVGGDARQRPL